MVSYGVRALARAERAYCQAAIAAKRVPCPALAAAVPDMLGAKPRTWPSISGDQEEERHQGGGAADQQAEGDGAEPAGEGGCHPQETAGGMGTSAYVHSMLKHAQPATITYL